MFNNPNIQATHMQIDRLILAKSGRFQPQFRRAYDTVGTGDTIQAITHQLEQVAMVPGQVNAAMLGATAAGFVQPSAQVESQIHIAEGWDTPRFYFFMEVSFISSVNTSRQLIQGWTNHADVSLTSQLDPNMVFTINSITPLQDRQDRIGGMLVPAVTVGDSVHVLADSRYTGFESIAHNPDKLLAIRPSDLFANMSLSSQSEDYVNPESTLQTRNLITGAPKPASRRYAVPTEYAAHAISSYGKGMGQQTFGIMPPAQLFSNAAAEAGDASFLSNNFMRRLQNAKNLGSGNFAETFSYYELLNLDPSIDHRAVVVLGAEGLRETTAETPFNIQGQNSQVNNTKSQADMAATMLSNAIPGILVLFGMSTLQFWASNRHGQTNQFMPGMNTDHLGNQYMIHDARGIVDQDVTEAMYRAMSRILNEIIYPISMYGQMGYEMTVRCEIFNATSMSLYLEMVGHPVDYVAPTFADALTAPIVTNDFGRVNTIAGDFRTLVENIHQTDIGTDFSRPFDSGSDSYGNI